MKSFLKLGIASLAFVAAIAVPLAAQATTCDAGCSLPVTPIVPGQASISGFFTTDASGNVTGISGNVSGTAMAPSSSFSESGAITGLVNTINNGVGFEPPGSSGNYFTFSNTWNGSTFDGNGLLFAFDTGNYGNLYDVGGLDFLSFWLPDGNSTGNNFIPGERVLLNVSATPVPEPKYLFPSALALLIGVMAYRRKKQGLPMFGGAA